MSVTDAHVLVHPRVAVAVGVALVVDLGRDDHDPSMAHAALGDDALGEALDLGDRPSQQRDLHAAVVVEGDAHGGDGQIVVIAEGVAEPLGQIARSLIVDIGERGHAIGCSVAATFQSRLGDAGAHEIAHRLRTVLIAARTRTLVYFVGKIVVDGDGDPLHECLTGWRCARYDLSRWTSYCSAA